MRNWVKAESKVMKLMLELFISQKNDWVAAHLMCSNYRLIYTVPLSDKYNYVLLRVHIR